MSENSITQSPDTPPIELGETSYAVKPSFRCVVDEVVADIVLGGVLVALLGNLFGRSPGLALLCLVGIGVLGWAAHKGGWLTRGLKVHISNPGSESVPARDERRVVAEMLVNVKGAHTFQTTRYVSE